MTLTVSTRWLTPTPASTFCSLGGIVGQNDDGDLPMTLDSIQELAGTGSQGDQRRTEVREDAPVCLLETDRLLLRQWTDAQLLQDTLQNGGLGEDTEDGLVGEAGNVAGGQDVGEDRGLHANDSLVAGKKSTEVHEKHPWRVTSGLSSSRCRLLQTRLGVCSGTAPLVADNRNRFH